MRKFLLLSLVLTLVAAIFVGCGAQQTPGDQTGTDTGTGQQPTGEVVTLNMFQFKVEIADDLQRMIAEFENEHPNIKVRLETVGGGADYGAALKAKFAAGEKPDIFNNGGFKEAELWLEHLADLSNEPWAEHVLPIGKEPMTVDGNLYGMPVNLEGYGFIYNKDLFEQAGITEKPRTISELQAAAQKLQDAGITGFSAGYNEWWVVGQHLLNIPFAQQADPDAFIQGLYDGSESIAGNKLFQDFQKVVDTEIKFGNTNPLTTDYNTQVTLFATGQTAMLQQGNWTENMIYEINPDMNMGFLAIPLSDDAEKADRLPVGVPNNWVVHKNSNHVEEAKLFLNWMVSSETGKRFVTEEFAFIPAFDNIDPSGLGALGIDILEYSKEAQTIPWTWFKWPDGANKEFAAVIQAYVAGNYDFNTVLTKFQEIWDNFK